MITSGKGRLLIAVGRELRMAREAAAMSLRVVRQRSGDRFKASAVGGYERGERAITIDRFCELCAIYGVPPDKLLARAIPEKPSEIVLDPPKLTQEVGSLPLA